MSQYAWIRDYDSVTLLNADSWKFAFRMAIQNLIVDFRSIDDAGKLYAKLDPAPDFSEIRQAIKWFKKHDDLLAVNQYL